MRCNKCWNDEASAVEVMRDGEVVTSGTLCQTCWEDALRRFRLVQAEFQYLLESGVSRADANAIMCKRIDGEAPQ